jgi:hypothetical protein
MNQCKVFQYGSVSGVPAFGSVKDADHSKSGIDQRKERH